MTQTADTHAGNWGRWGDDDERGALNLITPDAVLTATRVCKTGKVYNLGLPVARYALCHVYAGEQFYNGKSAHGFTSHNGAPYCGIEKTGGFAGRAVILDVAKQHGVDWLEPGYNITADDLEAARVAAGVELGSGDIILVRTGWLDLFADVTAKFEEPPFMQPGLGSTTVEYIADLDIAAVGCDNAAVEVIPFDGEFLSLHIELLVKRGLTLLEHLVLSPLAADDVSECLLVVAPLLVTGGTGSPINPIAIA